MFKTRFIYVYFDWVFVIFLIEYFSVFCLCTTSLSML